jgi:hypothetical protein
MIRVARLTKVIACKIATLVSFLIFLQWLQHQSSWTVCFCIGVLGLYVLERFAKRQLRKLRQLSVISMIKIGIAVIVLMMIPLGYPLFSSYLFGVYVVCYCMKGMMVSFSKWVYSWTMLLMKCGLLGIVIAFGIGI